jgi:hypothetical protein
MEQAGVAISLIGFLRNAAALARDERRCDLARFAGKRCDDAITNDLAQALDGGLQA